MQYHCGNKQSEYNNNSVEGVCNRRTPYGFGPPYKTSGNLMETQCVVIELKNGNSLYAVLHEIYTDGAKSSDTLKPRMVTTQEPRTKDGE